MGPMHDVLALLLHAWQEDNDRVDGWFIMKTLHRSGPSVYRVLDRLEDAGWVDATWEVLEEGEDRPRRRFYSITPTGVEAARERAKAPASSWLKRLRPHFGGVA